MRNRGALVGQKAAGGGRVERRLVSGRDDNRCTPVQAPVSLPRIMPGSWGPPHPPSCLCTSSFLGLCNLPLDTPILTWMPHLFWPHSSCPSTPQNHIETPKGTGWGYIRYIPSPQFKLQSKTRTSCSPPPQPEAVVSGHSEVPSLSLQVWVSALSVPYLPPSPLVLRNPQPTGTSDIKWIGWKHS